MAGGLRDPDAPHQRKNVSYSHEEQVEFQQDQPSDFVGQAPARVVEEGILAPDTRRQPGYAQRKLAFEDRADDVAAEMEEGEAFTKSDQKTWSNSERMEFADILRNQVKDRHRQVKEISGNGLPMSVAYEPNERGALARAANRSAVWGNAAGVFRAGPQMAQRPGVAQVVDNDSDSDSSSDTSSESEHSVDEAQPEQIAAGEAMPAMAAPEDAQPDPIIPEQAEPEQAEPEQAEPAVPAMSDEEQNRLRAGFARSNNRYKEPQRYEGPIDDVTLNRDALEDLAMQRDMKSNLKTFNRQYDSRNAAIARVNAKKAAGREAPERIAEQMREARDLGSRPGAGAKRGDLTAFDENGKLPAARYFYDRGNGDAPERVTNPAGAVQQDNLAQQRDAARAPLLARIAANEKKTREKSFSSWKDLFRASKWFGNWGGNRKRRRANEGMQRSLADMQSGWDAQDAANAPAQAPVRQEIRSQGAEAEAFAADFSQESALAADPHVPGQFDDSDAPAMRKHVVDPYADSVFAKQREMGDVNLAQGLLNRGDDYERLRQMPIRQAANSEHLGSKIMAGALGRRIVGARKETEIPYYMNYGAAKNRMRNIGGQHHQIQEEIRAAADDPARLDRAQRAAEDFQPAFDTAADGLRSVHGRHMEIKAQEKKERAEQRAAAEAQEKRQREKAAWEKNLREAPRQMLGGIGLHGAGDGFDASLKPSEGFDRDNAVGLLDHQSEHVEAINLPEGDGALQDAIASQESQANYFNDGGEVERQSAQVSDFFDGDKKQRSHWMSQAGARQQKFNELARGKNLLGKAKRKTPQAISAYQDKMLTSTKPKYAQMREKHGFDPSIRSDQETYAKILRAMAND